MSPSNAVQTLVPEDGSMNNLVSLLIALATARGGSSPDTRIDDISQAARTSLTKALSCMSAVDFIDAVLSILKSGDSRVCFLVSYCPPAPDSFCRFKAEPWISLANVCTMSPVQPASKSRLVLTRVWKRFGSSYSSIPMGHWPHPAIRLSSHLLLP
jgi:hypothetical protein